MPTSPAPKAARWCVSREFAPCRHSATWLQEAYLLLLDSHDHNFAEKSATFGGVTEDERLETTFFEERQGCHDKNAE